MALGRMPKEELIPKVLAYITRKREQSMEVLVFRHVISLKRAFKFQAELLRRMNPLLTRCYGK
jgi:hypothetical protein